MTKAGIDGLSRGNNLGLIMRGLNNLKFYSLDRGVVERPMGLEHELGCSGETYLP